jgi:hypothetical protein
VGNTQIKNSIFMRCAMMVLMALTALPLYASFPRSDYHASQVAKVASEDVRFLPEVKPYDGAASSLLCASAPLREKIYYRHFVWRPDIAGQQTASLESGAEGVGAKYVDADTDAKAVTEAPAYTCTCISVCPLLSIRRWF